MSNSNGKITAPVSIENDIVPVLGETTYSLENLCRSNKINKWSYIKPIQDSNPVYGANGVIAWGSNSVSITFNPLPMGTGTTYNEIFAAFYFVDPNTEP